MGFLQGLITGLTGDDSAYDDDSLDSDGSIIGDFLGGAVGGLVRGVGSAFLEGLADDSEDKGWLDWVNSFEDEVNADTVHFEVKHKLGHKECTLTAYVSDESGEILDQNSWEVEYDDEIKQMHNQTYKIHEEQGQTLLDWVMTFNDNPNADHTYSEVKHVHGEENATVTVQVIAKDGSVIATEEFNGSYEDLKELHKDVSQFPIGLDEDSSEPVKQIEEKKEEDSVEQRLAKLKKLYESGILEEEEYKSKRKELIDLL